MSIYDMRDEVKAHCNSKRACAYCECRPIGENDSKLCYEKSEDEVIECYKIITGVDPDPEDEDAEPTCQNCKYVERNSDEMPCSKCTRNATDQYQPREKQLAPDQYKTVMQQLEDIKPQVDYFNSEYDYYNALGAWQSCYNIVANGGK